MIIQNYGLLTTGAIVDGACFLMTLVERASQCQLLVEAAAANAIPKVLILMRVQSTSLRTRVTQRPYTGRASLTWSTRNICAKVSISYED
jgi:ribulose-5-phosphate 4-epimerase/fuculose-1-phosphate aldolase